MRIISGEADFEYLNAKLEHLMASKRQANEAAKPVASMPKPLSTTSAPRSNKSDLHSSDSSDRALLSPDSSVRCEDPSCPIEGAHNIGRYYANGDRASSPQDEDFSNSQGKIVIPASHFFNFTVPPLAITEAYFRMTEGKASTDDEEIVRKYQKTHMYSPVVSEPQPLLPQNSDVEARPIQALVFDPKIYNAKHHELVFQKLEGDIAEGIELLESEAELSSQEAGAILDWKKPHSGRSMGLKVAILPRKQRILDEQDKERRGIALRSPGLWSSSEKTKLKRMPKAKDLREVQLTIKGNIISRIAEQAVTEAEANTERASMEAKSSTDMQRMSFGSLSRSMSLRSPLSMRRTSMASKRDSSGSTESEQTSHTVQSAGSTQSEQTCHTTQSSEAPEELDRALEINAALREQLRSKLEDGTFGEFPLQDEKGDELPSMFKFDYLKNLLLIVDHSFQEQIDDLSREFRPSGVKVSKEDLQAATAQHLKTYEMLREMYPSMKVEHIIRALRRSRGRARLENVC